MKKTRLSLTVAAVATAALTLSACSAGSGGTDTKKADDSVTLALSAAPTNLDFTSTSGAPITQALMTNVYETLITVDDSGELKPGLATEWQADEAGTEYTFELKDAVTFSNGDTFDANDVVFSFNRVKNDWVNGLKAKFDVVESVTAVDDNTVKVKLANPSQDFLFDLTTSVGAIFTETGVDDLANKPVGTGPFTISEWVNGERLVFSARDDYHGDEIKVSSVTFRYFADPIAATNALSAGDVDGVANLLAPELLSKFDADENFTVINGESSGQVTLSLNNKAAPFDDIRVRQAVLYAIDEQAVIDTAWAGYGSHVESFAAPADPYYEDLNDLYPYDPERAKQLLAEAGHESLNITYTVPNLSYATSSAEIVASQLAAVGINAEIKTVEFPAVWIDEVFTQKNYQMTTINHAEPRDLLNMFNNPDYYIGYDNSAIAPLVAAAKTADPEEYKQNMRAVSRQILTDAASGVLFLWPNLAVVKADLEGFPVDEVRTGLDLSKLRWKQ